MDSLFKILLINNFKSDFRAWKILLVEVFIIVACFLIVASNFDAEISYYELKAGTAVENQISDEQNLNNISVLENLHKLHLKALKYDLAYAPDQKFGNIIATAVASKLGLRGTVAYETVEILELRFNKHTTLAAVIFPNVEDDNVPPVLSIRIRFPSEFRTLESSKPPENFWITRCSGVLMPYINNKEKDIYIREGFLQIQHLIFLEWYKMLTQTTTTTFALPDIYARSFRENTSDESCWLGGGYNFTSFLYYFVFVVPFINLIWRYGREREENMQAHFWKYGCNYATYWCAHFIVSFLHFLLLDVIVFAMVKISLAVFPMTATFRDVNAINLLFFLVLHSIAMIVFVMILVSLFVHAKTCVLIGVLIYLITYTLLATTLNRTLALKSPFAIISFIILFSSSFACGMDYMKTHEGKSVFDSGMWTMLGCMIANIILELCLLFVIQSYRPGAYMEAKCFYTWVRKRKQETLKQLVRTPSWHNFEFGPIGGLDCVRVKNVYTTLKQDSKTQFLKNISMRIYIGEITVLLGPFGAGKTSLIRVLGGLKNPSSGWVHLDKIDIYENWQQMRKSIDLSMPSNTLLDLLTVRETLSYQIQIKLPSIDQSALAIELHKWMETMKAVLSNDDMLVKSMNFDQKRLLCLCCILSANTKLVLLDEPTFRMHGPETRLYWKILYREKADRAIVLATSSIDEAEAIADRIALLNNGILMAYGTPFFLKTKFNGDYKLIISKKLKFPTEPITALIEKFIPNILPENEIGDQLIYKVRTDKRPLYQKILLGLEKDSEVLGIEHIRMVGAELSEVYMTLDKRKNSQTVTDKTKTSEVFYSYVSKKRIIQQQLFAMLHKKLLYQAPNIIPLIIMAATVLLIVLIGALTNDFVVPPVRHNFINVGFPESSTSWRDILNGIEDSCEFIQIKHIKAEIPYFKVNSKSLLLMKDSLKCEGDSYDGYMTTINLNSIYGGVELNEGSYTSWFNQRIFHTAPLSLNLLHNIILRNSFPNSKNIAMIITNDPMPVPLWTRLNLLDQELSHLRVPLAIGTVLPITISCFIIFVVEERITHMLQLQIMAGLRMSVYWVVNFVWDWGTFFIYSIIFVLVMTLTSIDGFGLYPKILILLLMNVYCFAGLLVTYLISISFHASPLQSFLLAVIIQLLTGLSAYIFYWDVMDTNSIFFYIASLSPAFSLLDGIGNIYTETKEQEYCLARCERCKECTAENICDFAPQCCAESFFKVEDPGILISLTYMAMSCVVFGLLIFCVEKQRKERKFLPPKNVKELHSVCYPSDDKDVINVKKYIADTDLSECQQYRFFVDQVEYSIPKNIKELQTTSFALDKCICMGIYGDRYAGKTHLVKQLIGECGFSFGDIFVNGVDLKCDLTGAYRNISYCPQDRGYFKLLTPGELLRIFCLIRGISKYQVPERIREVSSSLNLQKCMTKVIGKLSFEERRKVSIALALIANNDIIILDEPTRGLPGFARREIWNVLRYERFCGKTIIFTSTDTLECAALADYVIMFNVGEMWAIGSVQYLRNKFTKGFFLEIKLKRDGATAEEANENFYKDVENLYRFISFMHEDSELCSRVDNLLRFYVPVENVIYSYIFGTLEKNLRRLNISDYTISQGTMEDALCNIKSARSN